MKTLYKEPLFSADGQLRMERFTPEATEIFAALLAHLEALGRRMFLPIDLLIVLIESGEVELARAVASVADAALSYAEVLPRLKVLSRELDEDAAGQARMERACFSRGFTRILEEAWELALGRGGAAIAVADLARAVTWRAEAVESASIRWAIRRLGEGKGDELFDDRGLLRLDLFDIASRGILEGAMKIAASHGSSFLGTPHLIAVLSSVRDSVLWRSAMARGLEPARLREELLRLIGSKPDALPDFLIGRKTLTPRMIRMLQIARSEAGEFVSEHDLVVAFLADGGSSLELVQALGLEQDIRQALGEPRVLAGAEPVEAAVRFAARRPSSPTLDMLGRDLTREAVEGRLPEIVGRELELERVFNVLMRREQRNPLLTGEAGVGKTALATALAQAIATGKAPSRLAGHRVIELNGASLMSGTSYRGDLEARITTLLEEASRDVILFIDEAHAVFSPRSGSNTPAEVPNHFKSALASGTIAVVGATTEEEYRRWFEQDPALKRRFERVEIAEPDAAMVRHILDALVPHLQDDYEVTIADEAVEAAIELSTRYIPEQRLPDKAKKVLMDAAIASARHSERDEAGVAVVDRHAVAEQIHVKTGVPTERLLRGEVSWWVGLEDRLGEAIVGQEAAVSTIAQALVVSRLKHGDQRRALATLAFVGPAGVGKATAARAMAREIFGDERAFLRVDLSDFQEAHALSRLIGSPPGYVGYEDADMLVTPLRRRPSSVVLLDEFDKAHPRIQDRLLRMLEEGELVDTRGHSADATNAIFVLSFCAQPAAAQPIGFGARQPDPLSGVDAELAAQVASHVDALVAFRDLSGDGASGARQLLQRLLQRFSAHAEREYGFRVELDTSLQEVLDRRVATIGNARAIEALVDEVVYRPLTELLLGGHTRGDVVLSWDASQGRATPTTKNA
ncbi:ATP-dependent Clp protease ATP-binding subunit [Lujinxingia vulgaris]|uniref:ATP-dependent Clp protease ATP-binding subunit n=1 Tax=Lujinxingia vulgaris TaxID=2600176 RepID=A0A5C6X9X2_9DELT|nr:AAA family ATPase [Lujinxingia vulgaris]TXD38166.1 ATP-dependent Clp protease ATP-binding subunit [Lujinxingia vulgaris]